MSETAAIPSRAITLRWGNQRVKIAGTGIDGSGKSSAIDQLAQSMGKQYRVIVPGPGRRVYSVINGQTQDRFSPFTKTVNQLYAESDRTNNRFIGTLASAMNVLGSSRVISPLMRQCLKPDVEMGDRDYYADPLVYGPLYQPSLARRSLDKRITNLRRLTGAPFSDLIFYLTVTPGIALERITHRLKSATAQPDGESPKPLQPHETTEHLTRLQARYPEALKGLQKHYPTRVIEIDTDRKTPQQVLAIVQEEADQAMRHPNKLKQGNLWVNA